MEKEIKKLELEAKIKSLESELIELKRLQPLMFTVLQIGINRMETSLKERLLELTEELESLSIKSTHSGGEK